MRRGERRKVDKLATVRIGSARYSVPRELIGRDVDVLAGDGQVMVEHRGELVAQHPLVAPGEVSTIDEHCGGPRRGPARAVRARSGPERAFLALGPTAEAFLRDAPAAGTSKLGECGWCCLPVLSGGVQAGVRVQPLSQCSPRLPRRWRLTAAARLPVAMRMRSTPR